MLTIEDLKEKTDEQLLNMFAMLHEYYAINHYEMHLEKAVEFMQDAQVVREALRKRLYLGSKPRGIGIIEAS